MKDMWKGTPADPVPALVDKTLRVGTIVSILDHPNDKFYHLAKVIQYTPNDTVVLRAELLEQRFGDICADVK